MEQTQKEGIPKYKILNETYFGLNNKTPEQTTRTFLYIMNSHFPSTTQKVYPFCSNQPEELNVSMLNPNDSICVNYCNTINQLLSDPKTNEKCITEIMKDDLYFKLLGYLNNYTQKEIRTFYNIFQTMEKKLNKNQIVHQFLIKNIEMIITIITSNLEKIRDNYVIIIVGKMLKKIIKDKDFISKILRVDYLNVLYSFCKTENFILSKEMCNLFFYIFTSPKVDSKQVAHFLDTKSEKFAELVINNLHKYQSTSDDVEDKYYYMRRESLILLDKIMNNPEYEKFNSAFTNNIDILKLIMTLMNHKSNQIIIRSITLLNFFFLDIENRNLAIKQILYTNKENFEIFFSKHTDLTEIEEKKNFILYELERLGNILNE